MIDFTKKYILHFIFIISFVGVLMSVYFSDILGWVPCNLCWYQRILLYPLVFIIPVAIIFKDTKVHRYILPLSIVGSLVALYHNLLFWKILPESQAVCQNGISCIEPNLQLYGFITIPLLSFVAFVLISILILIYRKYENK